MSVEKSSFLKNARLLVSASEKYIDNFKSKTFQTAPEPAPEKKCLLHISKKS